MLDPAWKTTPLNVYDSELPTAPAPSAGMCSEWTRSNARPCALTQPSDSSYSEARHSTSSVHRVLRAPMAKMWAAFQGEVFRHPLDVSRSDMIARVNNAPKASRDVDAMTRWMTNDSPPL